MRLLGTRGAAWQAEDSAIKTRPHGWTGFCFASKKIEAGLAFYPAGYVHCAGLQSLLIYSPRYPEHCDKNATESGRNRHGPFHESNKTRP
jgi:hypothetical protein